MRVATARGFRDVLPQEAAEREVIAEAVAAAFDAWGYGPVETPAVEEYASLEAAAGPLEGMAFRLFDLDGRLLALRPEMTVPVARLAASRLLPAEGGPLRLRYAAPVFREHASLRGQPRQFTQLGVELLGAGGPEADAEVVALAVEAVRAAGLGRAVVAVGTVGVLNALIEAGGAGEEWRAGVSAAAHARDLVGIDALASAPGVPPDVARGLRAVPRLRGGGEAVEACRELVAGLGCDDALDGLATVWQALAVLGLESWAAIDFGVVRGFEYYTGLVLEVYAPGVGAPVGGGGRYDNVLAAFGVPAPAAGFALGLERLHIAAEEHGAVPVARGTDDVVGGPSAARALCWPRGRG